MADFFLVKTNGGPFDGETRMLPRTVFKWPLPDELPDTEKFGGKYVKIQESTLPESVDESPHVARGAVYEWRVNA